MNKKVPKYEEFLNEAQSKYFDQMIQDVYDLLKRKYDVGFIREHKGGNHFFVIEAKNDHPRLEVYANAMWKDTPVTYSVSHKAIDVFQKFTTPKEALEIVKRYFKAGADYDMINFHGGAVKIESFSSDGLRIQGIYYDDESNSWEKMEWKLNGTNGYAEMYHISALLLNKVIKKKRLKKATPKKSDEILFGIEFGRFDRDNNQQDCLAVGTKKELKSFLRNTKKRSDITVWSEVYIPFNWERDENAWIDKEVRIRKAKFF